MIPICHVQLLPILSGVQRAMLEMFEHLDRRSFELHVACQGPGPLSDELGRRGIECHFIPALVRPIRPWSDVLAYRQLYALFRRERFQLVHTHSSKPGILGRIAARRAGVPRVVHHVHGFAFHEFSPPWQRWLYRQAEQLAGDYCDRVVFVNDEQREQAVRWGIVPRDKTLTVHNGVDLARYSPSERLQRRVDARRALEIDDVEVVILVQGRLDEQKQSEIVPEIAARLAVQSPIARWRIVVAGTGPLENAVRGRVAELGLTNRVRFLGWQDEPRDSYALADVVLQPSLWEGLSLVLLEAHAMGLPTVASNIMGNREVISPATGCLCPPRDTATYAGALATLVEDAELRRRMGAAARRRAEVHFDSAACMGRIADLYDELLPGVNQPKALYRVAA